MRAAVYHRYGGPDVVQIEEIPTPTPSGDEVLVRVLAATIGVPDSAARSATPWFARLAFGLLHPKVPVLGCDFAGRIESIGPDAGRFAPGDLVLGTTGSRMCAHAEYMTVSERETIEPLPDDFDPILAAALVDATAISFLCETANLEKGQRLLVNGASGAVGSAAVHIAKHLGADVTGTCSEGHIEFVRSLGADAVFDYRHPDAITAAGPYDVVFDAAGKLGYRRARRDLTTDGLYMSTVPSLSILLQSLWTRWVGRRRATVAFTGLRPAERKTRDLRDMLDLVTQGELTPHVDAVYPLDQISDAYRHVERGKRGHIVVVP